jgi:hypothetical protein
MPIPSKPKARLETVKTVKTLGVSKPEALAASQTIRQVVEDPDTPMSAQSEGSRLANELLAAPTMQAREELMTQVAAYMARNV